MGILEWIFAVTIIAGIAVIVLSFWFGVFFGAYQLLKIIGKKIFITST